MLIIMIVCMIPFKESIKIANICESKFFDAQDSLPFIRIVLFVLVLKFQKNTKFAVVVRLLWMLQMLNVVKK